MSQWEVALAECGGDVVKAATACGLADLPQGTKALWGRSAEAAWGTVPPLAEATPACLRNPRDCHGLVHGVAPRERIQCPRGYRVRLYV